MSPPPWDAAARPARPSVSVVIPARNVGSTLGAQLEALAAQTYTGWWEVVLSENGSTDDTLEVFRRWSHRLPRARVVDARGRPGITHSRNTGAAAAAGELLLFCDGDDMVAPEWIESMCAAAATADLVGGHVDVERLNRPQVRQWRPSLTRDGLPVIMGMAAHVVGANFGVWRPVYWAVDGCDESFTLGGDDVDLSWRIQLAGGTVAFAPDAVVHYRLRPDLRTTHRQLLAYGMGAALLYRKFRGEGAERPPLPGTVKYWLRLLGHAPSQLAAPARRGSWVAEASYHWGCIRGALRHRVLFW